MAKVDKRAMDLTPHQRLLQRPFQAKMVENGIVEDYLAKKLKEELEAKETKFFQFQGNVIEDREVIAWGVRQKAREDANQLLGHVPAEKIEIDYQQGIDEFKRIVMEVIKEVDSKTFKRIIERFREEGIV